MPDRVQLHKPYITNFRTQKVLRGAQFPLTKVGCLPCVCSGNVFESMPQNFFIFNVGIYEHNPATSDHSGNMFSFPFGVFLSPPAVSGWLRVWVILYKITSQFPLSLSNNERWCSSNSNLAGNSWNQLARDNQYIRLPITGFQKNDSVNVYL